MKVALTGGIGSGKSTVGRLLAERGAIVIDADQIARDIVAPGQPALAEIRQRFGSGIVGADGALDRAALARIVFPDPAALADLEAITHPRIAERARALMAAAPPGSVVVYDMPLLVEQGNTAGWDHFVVVEAPPDVRRERLRRDRGMPAADIDARMATQASDEERRAVADTVIVNDGDLRALQQAVDGLWRTLTARPGTNHAGD